MRNRPLYVYNFYSSGEEVLREDTDDPPSTVLGSGTSEVVNAIAFWGLGAGLPFGTYAWVWQEKGKGTDTSDTFIGSTHGGWQFSPAYYTGSSLMSPTSAAMLSSNQLQTNSFFYFGSSQTYPGAPDGDLYLLDPTGGSSYAAANSNRILSDAIPAMTLPVGANAVTNLDVRAGSTRNFNMQVKFETSWPTALSTGDEAFFWYHSDFSVVAYPYTHLLFDKIVNAGNLNQ